MNPQPVLDKIADAILDGIPIDWSTIDLSDAGGDEALVEQLKTLETLRSRGRTSELPKPFGTWTWGHLQVFERIGQGAYGDVYRAWDTRLDREVALKLLPADLPGAGSSGSMVIEEGRLLARIRHLNVATIYGAERIDDRVGLWMEFVKGCTLQEALRSGRKFTAADVTRLGVELCHAVSAVHAAGLVHRDIKAQNVMLDDTGRLVLMDFGTGRALDEAVDLATDRRIAGTPLYLAPEVLSGGEATPQSDVYSIGVMLFRVLTNTYPVSGRDLADLRRAHAAVGDAGVGVDRAEIPHRFRRVISRAIDPDPARRYASTDELGAALVATGHAPFRRRVTIAAVVLGLAVALWGSWNLGLREIARPALVALGVTTPTVAVLPFTNVGSDPGNDDFVDGLTSEVIHSLAGLDGLQVISQTSSFSFKGRPRDLREVAKRLNVDLVVEATVQRAGNRLRINAQLVQVSGDVLWSEAYDRTLDDVFAIQDEISRAIVNKLRLTLGRGQRRYQTNLAAYELYLRGRKLVVERGIESAKEAVKVFEQVITLDPAYAPAHAGLAEAYAAWSWDLDGGLSFEQGLANMRPAAEKALELDPLLADAHAALGITYVRERDWENARKYFGEAIRLRPSSSEIRASYAISTLVPLGDASEAQNQLSVAMILDPLSLAVRRDLGVAQYVGGRYEDAVDNLRQVYDADPEFFGAGLVARALTQAGRPEEAINVFLSRPRPGDRPKGWDRWLMPAYVKLGRQQDIDRLLEQHKAARPYQQAIIYAGLGDKDRTFEALGRAVDDSPQRTAAVLAYPEMALLSGDPRLDDLKKRLNLR